MSAGSLGEIAALLTSLCFSATSTFFTLASRRVGSLTVNRTRLIIALALLTTAHWLLLGSPFPTAVAERRWFWLGLSGVIGLVLGDALLFQAFVWIGPRLSMLFMSLAPIIASLLAWAFLSEALGPRQIAGIVITLTGVAWVVMEGRGRVSTGSVQREYTLGVLFGLGAATGQAVGLVTAKLGLAGDFSALSGTFIRMLAASLALWGHTLVRGQSRATWDRLRATPRAVLFILGGAFTGPFLGVTFSLVAVQRTAVGVASTLMALPPVFLLPIGYVVFKERFGWQAVVGTVVAIVGVATLFLA